MTFSAFVCGRLCRVSISFTARSILGKHACRRCYGELVLDFSTKFRASCTASHSPHQNRAGHVRISPEWSSFETGSTTQLRGVRSYSTASETTGDSPTNGFSLVYTAPLAGAVKSVKALSLATAMLAAVGAPILVLYGNPSMSLIGRVTVTSLVTLLGVSTTLILHWFVKTYVTKLHFNKVTRMVAVETYSMFLRRRMTKFHISEAGPPSSVTSFSTFQANGVGYYVHSEVFEDRELLSQLMGSFSRFENKVQ